MQRAANMLTDLGVGRGDRVVVYLPLIPEAVVTMLAVARIGAIHSVVFGGFSAESLRARIEDAEAKLVVTADGGWRRGAVSALKPAVDEALEGEGTDSVEHVLVVKRGGNEIAWNDRDLWWHDEFAKAAPEHEAQAFPAETPLFILYTSGTTGKPKGIVHTSGGYLTQATYTHRNVFDMHPEKDVYWCTADIGWITGHSYVVYGPLANGVTQVLYEGTPDEPQPGRWWDIVDSYGVSLHREHGGEWEYDIAWKPLEGFPVTFGWMTAIRRGHAQLHRGLDIGVPSLVLRSHRTWFSRQHHPNTDTSDAVLDVRQIGRWAGCLGGDVTSLQVRDARHDVYLSNAEPRAEAYRLTSEWLERWIP